MKDKHPLIQYQKCYFPTFNLLFTSSFSDEDNPCSSGELWCGEQQCVHANKICDGNPDCSNNKDER